MSYESFEHTRYRYPSFGTALRRHAIVALIVLVGCTAAGVAWGYSQPVQYVAQAQLIAGAAGVTTTGTPAQAAAAETLAGTYSRVFDGDQVQALLREAMPDLPAVDASPIPDSSIIRIEATAGDPDVAVEAADAGVVALQTVVASLLSNQAAIEAAGAQMSAANQRLAAAETALAAAEDALSAVVVPGSNPAAYDAVAAASAEALNAEADAEALRDQYVDVLSESIPGNGVEPLAAAQLTSDTSAQRVQMGYAVGIVAGCLLGGGLAYLLEIIRVQRRAARGAAVDIR